MAPSPSYGFFFVMPALVAGIHVFVAHGKKDADGWDRAGHANRDMARYGPNTFQIEAEILERAKGFEPSTPTLARSCSTPELHPHFQYRQHLAALGETPYGASVKPMKG